MFTNFIMPPLGPDAAFYSAIQGFLSAGLLVILVVWFNALDLLKSLLDILKNNTPKL